MLSNTTSILHKRDRHPVRDCSPTCHAELRLLAAPLLLLLVGCGTVYTVERLRISDPAQPEQLEYLLPENLIHIAIPITTQKFEQGDLHRWADTCGIKPARESTASKFSSRFGIPTFRLTVNPDHADRFTINLSRPFSPLTSRSLKMKLNTSATPIAFSSTSADLSITLFHEAVLQQPFFRSSLVEEPLDCTSKHPNACDDCPDAQRTRADIDTIDAQLKSIIAKTIDDLSGIQAEAYDRITNDLADRRKRLVARFIGRTSTSTRTTTFIANPSECKREQCNWRLLKTNQDLPNTVHLQPIGANRFKMKPCPAACDSGDILCLQLHPKHTPPAKPDTNTDDNHSGEADSSSSASMSTNNTSRSRESAGFYYRVPGAVELKVTVAGAGNRTILSTARLPVAQYGRIAALPQRFGWVKSSIDQLDLDPLTGAITSISINGTNLAKEDVQRLLNYDVEREERDIASLERQRRALELEKAIRELQDDRNAESD